MAVKPLQVSADETAHRNGHWRLWWLVILLFSLGVWAATVVLAVFIIGLT